jgi:hypothetical protein
MNGGIADKMVLLRQGAILRQGHHWPFRFRRLGGAKLTRVLYLFLPSLPDRVAFIEECLNALLGIPGGAEKGKSLIHQIKLPEVIHIL